MTLPRAERELLTQIALRAKERRVAEIERTRPKAVAVKPELQALLDRVLRKCRRQSGTKCWLWSGAVGKRGYGRVKIAGRLALAHRVVAFAVGRIDSLHAPERIECVLHACDEPSCCNPAHLRPGTLSDNMQDCVAKGRHGGRRGSPPKRELTPPAPRLRVKSVFSVTP